MKIKAALFLISIVAVLTVNADKVDPDTMAPIWIDVRTTDEYETGHLPGAHNANFDRIGETIASITEHKHAPIILYCRSGRRSGFAKQTLEGLGYDNVQNAGGVTEVLHRANVAAATGADCVNFEC